MKRNSKRFLALFLSVAMTVTPAVLTQAENEDANVQVSVTPTPETEAEKTAVAVPILNRTWFVMCATARAAGRIRTPGLCLGAVAT